MVTMSVRDGDLVGTCGVPDGQGPFPGVRSAVPTVESLTTSCSCWCERGSRVWHWRTSILPETQPALTEVPIERIERGLRWPERSRTSPRLAAASLSSAVRRGANSPCLLLRRFQISWARSSRTRQSAVVWAGIDFSQPRGSMQSSWSFQGRPLPFVPLFRPHRASSSDRGMSVLPIYERGLDNTVAVAQAAIPIERACGPVLLISGEDDRMWPAARMCAMVVDRMRRNGWEGSIRHLNFPEAGHVSVPVSCSVPEWSSFSDAIRSRRQSGIWECRPCDRVA